MVRHACLYRFWSFVWYLYSKMLDKNRVTNNPIIISFSLPVISTQLYSFVVIWHKSINSLWYDNPLRVFEIDIITTCTTVTKRLMSGTKTVLFVFKKKFLNLKAELISKNTSYILRYIWNFTKVMTIFFCKAG